MLRVFFLGLVLLLFPVGAQAQPQCGTVSTCPYASTPLSGAELLYMVQNGVSKKIQASTLLINGLSGGPNTVLANPTAVSGRFVPTQLPSCAGATNALTYTNAVGFGCNVFVIPPAANNIIYYTPVAGDNTVALQAAINSTAIAKKILQLPCATTIQGAGPIFLQTNSHIRGCGKFSSIIQKTASSGATTFITNNFPTSNVTIEQFQIDGQGASQGGNFYIFVVELMTNFTVDNMYFGGGWGNVFYLYEDDTRGSGPGGRPATPYGQQYSSNVTVTNSVFDGTGTSLPSADLADFLRITNFTFRNNIVMNGGANCMGSQFNTNFVIDGNTYFNCWRAVYGETNYNGSITNNSIYGTTTSATGDNSQIGIWVGDANETYPAGGYAGSFSVTVANNHMHDMQRSTGTTGVIGVWVTGPPVANYANANIVTGNTCFNINGGGTGRCVEFAGYQINPVGAFNTCQLVDVCVVTTAAYTAPGYASAQTTSFGTFFGNVPNQTGTSLVSSTGMGAGTATMVSGSRDNAGIIQLSPGAGAAAQGNVVFNLSAPIAGNNPVCTFTPQSSSAAWAPFSTLQGQVNSLSQMVVTWNNGGAVALTAGQTYRIAFSCWGS